MADQHLRFLGVCKGFCKGVGNVCSRSDQPFNKHIQIANVLKGSRRMLQMDLDHYANISKHSDGRQQILLEQGLGAITQRIQLANEGASQKENQDTDTRLLLQILRNMCAEGAVVTSALAAGPALQHVADIARRCLQKQPSKSLCKSQSSYFIPYVF